MATPRPALARLLAGLALFSIPALAPTAHAETWGVRLTYSDDPARTVAVSWNSDDPAQTQVLWGTAPDALDQTATADEIHTLPDPLGTTFTAVLTDLSPNTTYYYRVGHRGGAQHPNGDPFQFTTLSDDPCDPVRFVVIGDNRADFDDIGPSALWPGILAEAMAEDPAFFVNTGDMVKNGDAPLEWRNFVDESEIGFALVPSILTMGNHDEDDTNGDGAMYNRLFGLPRNERTQIEDYYSIDIGPVHFVSLSTQFTDPGSQALTDMVAWLEADLAATDQPWIFVFFHKAIYTKGNHSTGEEDDGAINAALVPVFDAHDVDMVFNGHSHNYERYVPSVGVDEAFGGSGRELPAGERGAFTDRASPVPDGATGTTYVVTGGAGALTTDVFGFTCEDAACTYCTGFNINCEQDVFDRDQDAYVVYAGQHNFVVIEVDGNRATVRALASETGNQDGGFELDSFTMQSSDFDGSLCASGPGDDALPDVGGDPDVGPTEDVPVETGGEDPSTTDDAAETLDDLNAPETTPPVRDDASSDGELEESTTEPSSGCCGVAATGGGSAELMLLAAALAFALRRRARS